MKLLLVCLGGAIGSGVRYLVALWAASTLGVAFPFGTLIVNLSGSFLLGVLMHAGASTEWRLFLATGMLGGFTTYSTFNYETTSYLRQGAWMMGALNIAVTVVGCLVAGFAGLALARVVFGR